MGRRKTIRVILEAAKADDLILGLRAARWLLDKPASQGDAIIAYGEEPTIDFYVRRTKTGVSARRSYRP